MTNQKLRSEFVRMFGEARLEELEATAKETGGTLESLVVAHVAHGDLAHRFDGVVTADKIAEVFGLARYVDAMNAHVPDSNTGA